MNWGPLIERLQSVSSVHLLTHRMPDSDGVGSQLALYHALRPLGLRVHMYNFDPPPRICRYLDGADRIAHGDNPPACDLIIALDAGSAERLGMPQRVLRHPALINIDHHASNSGYGAMNFVDDRYCATGAMVYELLQDMRIPIGAPIAQALYASILTDTNAFRADGVNAEVHRMAAELIDAGADPALAARHAYANHTPERFSLLKDALDTLHLHDNKRSAWMHLTQDMFRRNHCRIEDSEGFIEYARSIGCVDITVLMCQVEEQCWKVTFRGKGACNVGRLAMRLGGGGHRHAAGCTMQGDETQVRQRLRALVRETLQTCPQ